MAKVLKKRALAEYSHQVTVEVEPPLKKLRLISKPVIENTATVYIGLLNKCKTSNEALQLLLRISESLHFQEDEVLPAVNLLFEYYHQQSNSAVRVVVLSLISDISSYSKVDLQVVIEDTLNSLKKEESHKVLTQGLSTLMRLGKLTPDNISIHLKLVQFAKQHLNDTSYSVKNKAMDLIGELQPLVGISESSVQATFKLIMNFTHSQDARVRSAAFNTVVSNTHHCLRNNIVHPTFEKFHGRLSKQRCIKLSKRGADDRLIRTLLLQRTPVELYFIRRRLVFSFLAESALLSIVLHERGLKLKPSHYSSICIALRDDYEIVRQAALKLVWILGVNYPENTINLPDSEEEIRLIDDAFGNICTAVNDLSVRVRTQACKLLGSMTAVSSKFLHQTLDKKLMSNMRKKKSAHERDFENLVSGEWASGNKWADDKPRELIDSDAISLMRSGACGAFVHGLEDEFLEVRTAAVEAICNLAQDNNQFASVSLDFLVDMFNDEIEDVRLIAINSLTKMSRHIELREDQLETILGALEDFSMDVREGLHLMLASCRLSTKDCLQMCVDGLLDNLKKYPQDKKSTWHCLQKMGSKHPTLTLSLVPSLLAIHPFFDMPEPNVDDPAYICILILVLNAAQYCPPMLQLFEENTIKHYSYLRDTMPNLVPQLKFNISLQSLELKSVETATSQFLESLLSKIEAAPSNGVRTELLGAAERDLDRLSQIDSTVAGSARLSALFISSQLLFSKIINNNMFCSNSNTAQQTNTVKKCITRLLQNALKLEHCFVGLDELRLALVKQFKLKVLALHLVYIVRATNQSARALTHFFLSQVDKIHKELVDQKITLDSFTALIFKELSKLEETKPGAVARCMQPLLHKFTPQSPPSPDKRIKMCSVEVNSPTGGADNVLKFTAGLIMGVPLDADLYNVSTPNFLRLRLKYPDQQTHLIVPRPSHLRPVPDDEGSYRLVTTALVSHQVWTEASAVELSVVLDLSEKSSVLGSVCIIDLCKPIKLYVSPKPVKRGI